MSTVSIVPLLIVAFCLVVAVLSFVSVFMVLKVGEKKDKENETQIKVTDKSTKQGHTYQPNKKVVTPSLSRTHEKKEENILNNPFHPANPLNPIYYATDDLEKSNHETPSHQKESRNSQDDNNHRSSYDDDNRGASSYSSHSYDSGGYSSSSSDSGSSSSSYDSGSSSND